MEPKTLFEGDVISNKMNLVGYHNHMLRMQPSICHNHVATELLLVLGTNSTYRHNFTTHMAAERTRKLSA
jgi:hypothetical protein